jgi:hypothetical protein
MLCRDSPAQKQNWPRPGGGDGQLVSDYGKEGSLQVEKWRALRDPYERICAKGPQKSVATLSSQIGNVISKTDNLFRSSYSKAKQAARMRAAKLSSFAFLLRRFESARWRRIMTGYRQKSIPLTG